MFKLYQFNLNTSRIICREIQDGYTTPMYLECTTGNRNCTDREGCRELGASFFVLFFDFAIQLAPHLPPRLDFIFFLDSAVIAKVVYVFGIQAAQRTLVVSAHWSNFTA
jgi:hypothetical protein